MSVLYGGNWEALLSMNVSTKMNLFPRPKSQHLWNKAALVWQEEESPTDRAPTWKNLSDRDHPHQSFRTDAREPRKEQVLICSDRSSFESPCPERARLGDVTTPRSHHRLCDSGNCGPACWRRWAGVERPGCCQAVHIKPEPEPRKSCLQSFLNSPLFSSFFPLSRFWAILIPCSSQVAFRDMLKLPVSWIYSISSMIVCIGRDFYFQLLKP